MSGDDTARFIYLGLLLAVIGGVFLVENRKQMGQTVKQAAIWVLIFVGAVAGIGLWDDIRQDLAPRQTAFDGGRVEVPISDDGHYYLTLELDGTEVDFVVDTGATEMVLTLEDAERIGIDTGSLAFLGQARTANGRVATASVWVDTVRLGDVEDRNFRASVNGGELDTSLLGMAYLNRFERVEFNRNRLTLSR